MQARLRFLRQLIRLVSTDNESSIPGLLNVFAISPHAATSPYSIIQVCSRFHLLHYVGTSRFGSVALAQALALLCEPLSVNLPCVYG